MKKRLYGKGGAKPGPARRAEPCELKRKHVTLSILLEEYIAQHPDGLRYSSIHVHDHHVARRERGNQHLIDIGLERDAVDRSVEHHGRDHSRQTQAADESRRFPVAMWDAVGVGSDVSIRELAEIIMDVVGVEAQIRFDPSKPDGTPRKLMDSGRLFAMGWRPKTSLEEGLRKVYARCLENAWHRGSFNPERAVRRGNHAFGTDIAETR